MSLARVAVSACLNGLATFSPTCAGRFAYTLFCRPPRTNPGRGPAARLPGAARGVLGAAEVMSVPHPGGLLRAYHWGPPEARRRVLLVHGWGGRASHMVAFARTLAASGLGVVAYDAPAHGDSTGRRADLPGGAEALRAVSDVLGPFEAAITHSFGGMVAALAAEGGPPLTGRVGFGSLVLVSPPARLGDLMRWFGSGAGLSARTIRGMREYVAKRAGRAVAEFDTGALLRGNVRRLLVIHDEDDPEVPFADGKAVAGSAGGELVATRRLGHRRVLVAPEVARAAAEFVLASR